MNTGLRVLVADDERPARDKLRRFLEESPGVSVVYEASDGATVLDIVGTERPDVVFLDIGMPGLDGLAAAESIAVPGGPYIVFVTAYDEHALQAFEIGATDYLLKPYDRQRFDVALERVKSVVSADLALSDVDRLRHTLQAVMGPSVPFHRLMVHDGDRARLITTASIVRFDAAKNYVRVLSGEGEFRIRAKMNELERRLPKERFARINRSQIVNLDHVKDFTPVGHGDLDVRMHDGSTLRLSRRYKDRIEGL